MTEAEWLACEDPLDLVHWLSQGAVSERKARWFGADCCRRLARQAPNWPAAHMITLLEQLADGETDGSSVPTQVDSGLGGDEYKCWFGPPPWACEDAVLQAAFGPASRTALDPSEEWMVTLNRLPGLLGVVSNMRWALQPAGVEPSDQAATLAPLLRDIFGNPFRPAAFDPAWRTPTAVALASGMYESRAFDRLPILADALQDAGCDSDEVLDHCRGPGPHVRGCWVVDLVLGRA